MPDFPIVEVRGKTHRDMGQALGEQLTDRIREVLAELRIPGEYQLPAHRSLLCGSFLRRMRRYAPELLEEMEGIAEGAGVPRDDVFVYNDLPEMWQADAFGRAAAAGCTAFGFTDSPIGPIIGKNNDIGENAAKYHIPHRYTFPDGRKALIFTWPGTVWANAFVNEQGLAFGGATVTSAGTDPEGFPSNFMFRVFAERAGSVEEAVALIPTLPISTHAFTGVLADEHTVRGLEVGVGGHAVLEPEGGACWGTNHFTQAEMLARQKADAQVMATSWARWARLEELTKDTPHTVEGAKSILAHHADWGSICQHGKGPAQMHTSASYVMVPRERRVDFAYGRPCQVDWVEVPMA